MAQRGCPAWGQSPNLLGFVFWALTPILYLASGSRLSCSLIAFGRFSLPPSRWKLTRVPEVVHSARPFQPAAGSSMRPSTFLGNNHRFQRLRRREKIKVSVSSLLRNSPSASAPLRDYCPALFAARDRK